VDVESPGGRRRVASEDLFEMLAMFAEPRTLREVLQSVPVHGATEWAERSGTRLALVGAGALVSPAASDPLRRGFADPAEHARMLDDRERVEAYVAALRAVVRPDDVVLDLGTGTGILAVAAARAGARRVFAIEESSIADVAEDVFARNDVGGRITLVRGHSTGVSLPERATVLVTETLGTDPLREGLLIYLEDARRRLLVPGGRIIPARLQIIAQLVDVAGRNVASLDERAVETWRARYGIDLGALHERHRAASARWTEPAGVIARLPRCSAPFVVEDLDLQAETASSSQIEQQVEVTSSAERVAVALGFRALLAPNVHLDVGPQGSATSHWGAQIETPPARRGAMAGQRIGVGHRRDRSGCALTLAAS